MAAHAEPASAAQRDSPLDAAITKKMLLLFIIGDILGGGIYARTGEVAGEIGGAIWTGFALAAIIAAFTAASYAELVSKYPQAAGAALYIHRAFKAAAADVRRHVRRHVLGPRERRGAGDGRSAATTERVRGPAEDPRRPRVIAVVTAINFRGIKESVELQRRLHADRARRPGARRPDRLRVPVRRRRRPGARARVQGGRGPLLLIVAGASIAFYALIGFEDAVNVAEETKDSTHTFPRTLFLGLGIAGAIYLLVTIVAGMAVPADTAGRVRRPAARGRHPGPAALNTKVFSAIALFALINGCLLNLVMASRLMYGMAREGVVPGRARQGARRPQDAVGGDPVHGRGRRRAGHARRPRDARGHDRPAVAVRLHRRPRRAARAAPHAGRPRPLPRLDGPPVPRRIVTCAALAVQSILDDPKLVLWAGGLIVLGLVLWVDRARRAMIEAWHGTSPPTLSSSSSWTGCATSCARRSGRSRPSSTSSARRASGARSRRCRSSVKERGLWAAHLPPDLGGQGFGQVKLGLMHEILGTSPFAPAVFGNAAPDSGNSEILALAGHAGPEGALPAPAARGRPAQRVLDDRARDGGVRSHAAADARRARRRRVGHQRPQVVLDQRQRRRLPDRDGGHEPGRAAAPARLDAHRAGRHAGREHRPRHPDDGAPGRALRPLRRARRDLLRGRARAGRRAARRRGRGLPDRPAPARARAHPPLHALARRVAAGVRHAVRARRLALRVRLGAGREADGPELDRGLAGADAARRG